MTKEKAKIMPLLTKKEGYYQGPLKNLPIVNAPLKPFSRTMGFIYSNVLDFSPRKSVECTLHYENDYLAPIT
jgi:hypothetical protein